MTELEHDMDHYNIPYLSRCEMCEEYILHEDGWPCADCGCHFHHECEKPAMVDVNGEMWCEGCAGKAAVYLHNRAMERAS